MHFLRHFRVSDDRDPRILRHFRVSDDRDPRFLRHFQAFKQKNRSGTRDCCTFSYFRTAKASGNTRLLNFFIIHEQQNECKHRDCCIFSYVFCHFTENKRGMPPHCVRFFDPSRLKRSFFLKSAPLSRGTAGNRRNRRPLGGTLRAPETSIFATPLAESTEKYL